MIDLVHYAELAGAGIILEDEPADTYDLEPEAVQAYLENDL